MELAWNPWALFGLLDLAVAWTLALFLYATGPSRSVNRRAALLLVAAGVISGTWFGLAPLMRDPRDAFAAISLGDAAYAATAFLYPMLLAAIDVPMTRWLRGRAATVALAVGAVLAALVTVVQAPRTLSVEPDAAGWSGTVSGAPALVLSLLHVAVLAFGLAVAISAYRRAAPGIATRRASAYLAAFALRDGVYVVLTVTLLTIGYGSYGLYISNAAIPLTSTLFVALLAYGVLRAQVFDIDARIRVTIRRGTLMSAFLVVFVVVTEAVQSYASDSLGYAAGGVAAGMLLLALRPMERLAASIASSAVPDRAPIATLDASGRAEMYREQARLAWEDGSIDRAERAMLDKLRERLALARDDASRLEEQALADLTPGT